MTKFSMLKLSLFAAVLALASTATLNAQTPGGQAKFQVPFTFQVDSVQFAPGTYTVAMLNAATLKVTGPRNSVFAPMHLVEGNKASTKSKLVFVRVGSQYFLRETWAEGSAKYLVTFQSKAEKQAAKLELAASHPATPAVEIAQAANDK